VNPKLESLVSYLLIVLLTGHSWTGIDAVSVSGESGSAGDASALKLSRLNLVKLGPLVVS